MRFLVVAMAAAGVPAGCQSVPPSDAPRATANLQRHAGAA
jgi:hypothetical protein